MSDYEEVDFSVEFTVEYRGEDTRGKWQVHEEDLESLDEAQKAVAQNISEDMRNKVTFDYKITKKQVVETVYRKMADFD